MSKRTKKKPNKIKIVLRAIAFILFIFSFFHGNAKNFPRFRDFLVPEYARGINAIHKLVDTTKLEQERIVKKGEDGFDVLVGLFLKKQWTVTGAQFSDKASITEFRGMGSRASFSVGGTNISSVMIIVESETGQESTILSYQVQVSLEKLLDDKLFKWAVFLFVVGCILGLVSFKIE